jgi:hypothetical protein
MFTISVKDAEKAIKEAEQQYSRSKVAGAIRMALNDTARTGKVAVRKSIQDLFNIKNSRINDTNPKKGLSVSFATNNKLEAEIRAGHIPVNLINITGVKLEAQQTGQEFSYASTIKRRKTKAVKGKKTYSGRGISLEIFKGDRKNIPTAFTVGKFRHFKSGSAVSIPSTAVFARGQKGKPGFQFGKARMPIDSLSTVSIGTASINSKAQDKYGDKVNTYCLQRLLKNLNSLGTSATG